MDQAASDGGAAKLVETTANHALKSTAPAKSHEASSARPPKSDGKKQRPTAVKKNGSHKSKKTKEIPTSESDSSDEATSDTSSSEDSDEEESEADTDPVDTREPTHVLPVKQIPAKPETWRGKASDYVPDAGHISQWTPSQVASYLSNAGHESHIVDKFLTHDISGSVLLDLQAETLKELDITSYGQRHAIMKSIEQLRLSSTQEPTVLIEPPLPPATTNIEKVTKTTVGRPKVAAKKRSKKATGAHDPDHIEIEENPESQELKQRIAEISAYTSARLRLPGGKGAWRPDADPVLGEGGKSKVKKTEKETRGSKVAYKRVDQLWDKSINNYKLSETVEDADSSEWDQYIFTIRRKFDWEHKYQETFVDIKSQPLKECLQHVMKDVKGVSLVQDTPHVDPNMLFLYLEECRTHLEALKKARDKERKKKSRKALATKVKHLKILVQYLDKDFAEIKKTLYPMLESNLITFDLLWALYKPNTISICPTYGDHDQLRAFKIDFATKESHFAKGTWYNIEGRYLEYDGKTFGLGTMQTEVSSFQGARKITSLDCYPLRYHKDPEALKAKLIERGKQFVTLKGMNYRLHTGMAYTKRKRQILKININGRVMVDPAIFRRINPNYPISTIKVKEEGELILETSGENDEDSSECNDCSPEVEDGDNNNNNTPSSSEESKREQKRKFRVVETESGKHQFVEIEQDEDGEEILPKRKLADLQEDTEDVFSDEELLIASPVVLGFAFSEKIWLEFTVSGISDVVWNEGAFDSLVLPDSQKSLVKALVSSHAFHPSRSIDDIISGKGKGLVAVLHGPPGTGKTLTAEGIADLLKCPLYMVSAGDLGTDPRTLEKELQNILDIAHSWGALLLLDEADVFLEKRSIQDIHRNALVSIFLRLLEYFQGILFLTTNRVETFDEAFVSRIHLSLRYGELSAKARKTVWKMFMDKVKQSEDMEVMPLSEDDYSNLAKRDVNGRQIKNLVRAAQALAVHEEKPLSMSHIQRVIDVAETFSTDLKGGTGYIDAMRGYT